MAARPVLFIFLCFMFSLSWNQPAFSAPGKSLLDQLHKITMVNENVAPGKVAAADGGKNPDPGYRTPVGQRFQLCFQDEYDFLSLENEVLHPFAEAFRKKDAGELLKLVSTEYSMEDWSGSGKGKEGDFLRSHDKIRESLETYFSHFKEVVDFRLEVTKAWIPRAYRDQKVRATTMDLFAQFDLRALDQESWRRQDRGELKIRMKKENGQWKFGQITRIKFSTQRQEKPSFAEMTGDLGLDKIPAYTRNEAIRRGGYALAVGDYNGDKVQDLFVGTFKEALLLQGKKNGPFTPVANAGIGGETLVKAAAFADFFNSGREDLFLVRFVPHDGKRDYKNDLVFYENKGEGKLSRWEKPFLQRGPSDYAMPLAVADFNKDNFLDFYVGFPGANDFTHISLPQQQEKYQVQGFFYNDGKDRFVDQTQNALAAGALFNPRLFPHSALAADYDLDNDMDLLVVDDRGNFSPAFNNQGQGTFTQEAEAIGLGNNGIGMGAAVGDINNDGFMDVALTNINFLAYQRLYASCQANWNMEFPDRFNKGLRLFLGTRTGKFIDASYLFGQMDAGEGLGGVEFVDYNNDGLLDIYVTNGLWSGSERTQDLSPLFVANAVMEMGARFDESSLAERKDKTQSLFMDILKDYRGPLYPFLKAAQKDRLTKARPSMAGHQRNRLFKNEGNNLFSEVGFLEGVDSLADGYIVAHADLNQDGKMDLILRNADPGTEEVSFPPVQVFQNSSPGVSEHSLVIRLQGRKSNRDAIGSVVTAKIKDKILTRHLVANNGTAQSEKLLHFGLGEATLVDQLTVTWPSGTIQILNQVPAGSLEIVEDQELSLSAVKP